MPPPHLTLDNFTIPNEVSIAITITTTTLIIVIIIITTTVIITIIIIITTAISVFTMSSNFRYLRTVLSLCTL